MTTEQATLFREWLETKAQNALEDRRKWAQDYTSSKENPQLVAYIDGLAMAYRRAAEKLATIITGQPERVGLSATTKEPYLANRKAAGE